MTFAQQVIEALLRAAGIALASLAVALPLRDYLASARPKWRRLAWAVLMAPYLTPVLLCGYAYAGFVLSLVRQPGWNELFYSAMLWLRLTPVAVLVLYFAPSPLTIEGMHCFRMLPAQNVWRSILFRIRGWGRAPVIAWAMVFLFAFGDFEMVSLWGLKTWTVAVFDAQAGGLPAMEALRLGRVPLGIEAGVLLAVLALIFRWRSVAVSSGHRRALPRRWRSRFAIGYLSVAALVVSILPLAMVAKDAVAGIGSLAENFTLGSDLASSLLFGAVTALCVSVSAVWVSRIPVSAAGLAAFGLIGPLPIALLAVSAFQLPGLRMLYNTPLPLVLVLTAILFPYALLLRLVINAIRPGPALHLAKILDHPGLLWDLKYRVEFWAAFLLFCWAYFELTASAIAAPVGMTPVFVRLYNLMHYGRTAVLSAMSCAAFAVPMAILMVPSIGRRIVYARRKQPN